MGLMLILTSYLPKGAPGEAGSHSACGELLSQQCHQLWLFRLVDVALTPQGFEPAKEVAQIGSAIGREFSHTLLFFRCEQAGARVGISLRPSDLRWLVVPARCAS